MTELEKYIAEDERIRAQIAKKNSEIEELRNVLGKARREYIEVLNNRYAEYVDKKVKITFAIYYYGKRKEKEVEGYFKTFKERTHKVFVPCLKKVRKDGAESLQDVPLWDVFPIDTITEIEIID